MGRTAENAERYAVSRVEQEKMAVRSHAKAVARARPACCARIATTPPVAEDGCIRPGTLKLAQLKPAFGAASPPPPRRRSPMARAAGL